MLEKHLNFIPNCGFKRFIFFTQKISNQKTFLSRNGSVEKWLYFLITDNEVLDSLLSNFVIELSKSNWNYVNENELKIKIIKIGIIARDLTIFLGMNFSINSPFSCYFF